MVRRFLLPLFLSSWFHTSEHMVSSSRKRDTIKRDVLIVFCLAITFSTYRQLLPLMAGVSNPSTFNGDNNAADFGNLGGGRVGGGGGNRDGEVETFNMIPNDKKCENPAINFLTVAPPIPETMKQPRILCFVATIKKNHDTRIRAIRETWGRKCDKLIISSDAADESIGAIFVRTKPGYWQLWHKIQKTLVYLHFMYRDDGYDWILKADDDTYVIMENLKAFLAYETKDYTKPQIQKTSGDEDKDEEKSSEDEEGEEEEWEEEPPLIYGRIMKVPTLETLNEPWGWFKNNRENRPFGKMLYRDHDANDPMLYAHGGPGYIMNWKYVDTLVWILQGPPRFYIRGHVGEDTANAVTMLLRHNIHPESTRDPKTGLERSHPETPEVMFENPTWLKKEQEHIENTGNGTECCSPNSISYHHLTPEHMRLLEYQLYECPKQQKVASAVSG